MVEPSAADLPSPWPNKGTVRVVHTIGNASGVPSTGRGTNIKATTDRRLNGGSVKGITCERLRSR